MFASGIVTLFKLAHSSLTFDRLSAKPTTGEYDRTD